MSFLLTLLAQTTAEKVVVMLLKMRERSSVLPLFPSRRIQENADRWDLCQSMGSGE